MKKWKQDFNKLVPLDYISFLNVPMIQTSAGPAIDLKPELIDKMAAKLIVENKLAICGKEVKFLRKTMGLSLEKFSAKLGLSSATIFHWERAEKTQLAPVNEVAVRTLLAEELNINLKARFSELIGIKPIKKIEIKAS